MIQLKDLKQFQLNAGFRLSDMVQSHKDGGFGIRYDQDTGEGTALPLPSKGNHRFRENTDSGSQCAAFEEWNHTVDHEPQRSHFSNIEQPQARWKILLASARRHPSVRTWRYELFRLGRHND